jgi:hypothetical protein
MISVGMKVKSSGNDWFHYEVIELEDGIATVKIVEMIRQPQEDNPTLPFVTEEMMKNAIYPDVEVEILTEVAA